MIWIELLILLACIVIGARLGGIALGALAGVGLFVFVFLLGLPPGGPPQAVLGMIIAVITALATMQAAGGLDYLVSIAEKVMRKRPQWITFVAPIVTYILVLASGTAHVIYALLPVIAEVSRNGKVRPERPLSISVIAGFQGVIASPISAATVAMLGFLLVQGISLPRLLAITIPSTFLGVVIGSLSVAWRGKDLDDDPVYQKRLAAGELKLAQAATAAAGQNLFRARGSMLLFLLGIVMVVLIGIFPNLRPAYQVVSEGVVDTDQVSMGMAIMIVMIAIAGLIMVVFKSVSRSGVERHDHAQWYHGYHLHTRNFVAGLVVFRRQSQLHRRRHRECAGGLSVDVCDRDVCAVDDALQPGCYGCDSDACWCRAEVTSGHVGRALSCR